MKFCKMHGIGNDFIFIENFNKEIENPNELAKKICHRHFGIGADGLILIQKTESDIFEMVIINSDGSNANMCGNATRCFGKYIYDKGYVKTEKFPILTGDGIKNIEVIKEGNKVTGAKVFMGNPSFDGKDIGLKEGLEKVIREKIILEGKEYEITSILSGVPHTIVIGKEEEFDVSEGRLIEKYEYFKNGTNVNFVTVIDDQNAIVRTWERGAGATLACGTGACASIKVLNQFGLVKDKVKAKLPGGDLIIEVSNEGVYMTGNAEYICEGKIL